MQLGRYRLLAQLGAGPDGASYRAADDAEAPAEVHVLSGAVAPERRTQVARRLRLAAMIRHPAAVRIQDLMLDHDPPYVALERVEGKSLAESFGESRPTPADVRRTALDLCEVLAEAHHLGLVHGQLRPSRIHRAPSGDLKLDFTGLETGEPPPTPALVELEASCRPPESAAGGPADAAADLYSLGAILYWLLRGRPHLASPTPVTQASPIIPDTRAVQATWQTFVPLLLAEDPSHRPPVQLLLPRLRGEADPPADLLGAETAAGLPTPDCAAEYAGPTGSPRPLSPAGEAGRGRHGFGLPGRRPHRRPGRGGEAASGAVGKP